MIKDTKDINKETEEGKLLHAALCEIMMNTITLERPVETPMELLERLNKIKDLMYNDKTKP